MRRLERIGWQIRRHRRIGGLLFFLSSWWWYIILIQHVQGSSNEPTSWGSSSPRPTGTASSPRRRPPPPDWDRDEASYPPPPGKWGKEDRYDDIEQQPDDQGPWTSTTSPRPPRSSKGGGDDDDDDHREKSGGRGWFSWGSSASTSINVNNNKSRNDDFEKEESFPLGTSSNDPLPPPPPPKVPIHYQFRARGPDHPLAAGPDPGDPTGRKRPPPRRAPFDVTDQGEAIPDTFLEPADISLDSGPDDDDGRFPRYASPRRDAMGHYMSTRTGRLALLLSSGTVGAMLGVFVAKSLSWQKPQSWAVTFFVLFALLTYVRNSYGELVRALGLTLIFALQRSGRIHRQYPTFRHVKALLGAGPRRPFPPRTDNPWAYRPLGYDDDVEEFNMLYTVVAMALVGSTCGGNLPLIPSWFGALAGATALALSTTTRDARGDLARTMGMRTVALVQEVLRINQELQLLPKLGVVSGKILDKMLILDRKHRIKDRLWSAASWTYDQVARAAARVQRDMQQGRSEPGPPPDDNNKNRFDRDEMDRPDRRRYNDNNDRRWR